MIAATREDIKKFFRGLQKYTKTGNTIITEVTPINLAGWDFKSAGQLDLLELIQKIYQMDTSYYGNIEELNESYGKIQVTRLADAIGTKHWPILPLHVVFLRDLQMHEKESTYCASLHVLICLSSKTWAMSGQ